MCSIHLDDATAAILSQNAQHTPAYWWRGYRVTIPISTYGDDKEAMMYLGKGKFGQNAVVTHLLLLEGQPSFSQEISHPVTGQARLSPA